MTPYEITQHTVMEDSKDTESSQMAIKSTGDQWEPRKETSKSIRGPIRCTERLLMTLGHGYTAPVAASDAMPLSVLIEGLTRHFG